MTEARWKLVVDGQAVTIASDRFQFTTNGSRPAQNEFLDDNAIMEAVESSQMESVVSELQTMTKRTYGQYCGLARALEVVGERWSMLIVRDLLVGPKSVTDLHRGLPRMAADILCSRLNELEHSGVVRRGGPSDCDGSAVYELTDFGKELDEITFRLGRWGTRLLGEPRPEDIVTPDALVIAMRATFQPQAARGLRASYELRIGKAVIHMRIDDGALQAATGALPGADLVIEPGLVLKDLLAGKISPAQAIADGSVRLTGDTALLTRFTEVFRIHPT